MSVAGEVPDWAFAVAARANKAMQARRFMGCRTPARYIGGISRILRGVAGCRLRRNGCGEALVGPTISVFEMRVPEPLRKASRKCRPSQDPGGPAMFTDAQPTRACANSSSAGIKPNFFNL